MTHRARVYHLPRIPERRLPLYRLRPEDAGALQISRSSEFLDTFLGRLNVT